MKPPLIRHADRLRVGDYYVNEDTGAMVQIMHINPAGCLVQNVLDDVDATWTPLTHEQITNAPWRRIQH